MAQFNSIKAKNECAYAWHWRVDANMLIFGDWLGFCILITKPTPGSIMIKRFSSIAKTKFKYQVITHYLKVES